jgi:hypothetical protein
MPKTGHFILHSNFLPQITAGPYELRTQQTGLPFAVSTESTHVNVAAPRFTMPVDQIVSSFPPANAEGAFGDRLPQIVLKRRTLPWERNPEGKVEVSTKPWLALVVVAEGEAELSSATPVADCVTQGTALLDPQDKDVEQGLYLGVTETVVKKIFPCEQDLDLLTHVREVDINDTELANGDDDGWLAVVLANRLPVFDQANAKPVRYMACLVNVEGQLAALPKPTPPVAHFGFALAQDWSVLASVGAGGGADPVVMGGMNLGGLVLPHASGAFAAPPQGPAQAPSIGAVQAHGAPQVGNALDGARAMAKTAVGEEWVSATKKIAAAAQDPDARRMVRDTMGMGFRYPIGKYAIEKVLRFPVLAHWSFTTSEGDTFETLMQALDVGLLGTLPELPKAEPGKPEPAPQPASGPEVVATGHIGLAHRARRGDAVKAWYRGPCVPFPSARDGAASRDALPLAHAADQLRRVIPDGREDLALAAAFEIGRLLALSQLSTVSALLRLRGEQFGAGRVREILSELLPFELPGLLANAGAERVDLGRFVAVQVIDVLSRNAERMLGPQRPVADPGRPLKVDGELDRVIAGGLGLDLDVLRKRGATMGVLAALETTAVPLAGTLGQAGLDKRSLLSLQGALQAQLQRTLAVALPPTVSKPPGKPDVRGQPATPGPDALDALIDRATASDDDEESPR